MRATASSSSAPSRLFELDLATTGRLAPLPAAFLRGEHLDLLAPLRFLGPGSLELGASPACDRAALATALGAANRELGHARAEELATLLADPTTRVIVTGQQPGLLGGPLMSLTKAAAAARFAQTLRASGDQAVAIFWIATEDHDFTESARATVLGREGPERLDLGVDPAPLHPLGARVMGPAIGPVLERLEEVLGPGALERVATLRSFYHPEASFGSSFARLLIALLGDDAPLFLDSRLPALKTAQAPHLRRLVEARDEVDAAYEAAETRVEARGFELQVKKQRGASPLFLIHQGERRRIEWLDATTFGLRGLPEFRAPIADLLATIATEPAAVSPGVLARPAIQDAVLGTSLQIMGPAELSYLTQAAAIYPILGLTAPATTLRPQALVLDPKQVAQLEELELGLDELWRAKSEDLIAARLGQDLVGPFGERTLAELDALRQPLIDLDGSLESPWRKTRENIERALEMLAGKVTAASARRHEVQLRRLENLRRSLLPFETLQERELAVGYFFARYGASFAKALFDQLDLDGRKLSPIFLSF